MINPFPPPDQMHTTRERTVGGARARGISAIKDARYPLITVITAVFNGEAYLAGCIDSVFSQSYPNIEHIVIDGSSTDGTLDVLHRYNDRLAFWVSEPDNGVYDAWNKGILEARGEWICFVGADDELLPNAVGEYMHLAQQYPNAEYLSSRECWVHPSGYKRIRGKPWSWSKFRRWNCVAHVGSMHRRTLFERLGLYDLSFGTASDYEFLLRGGESLRTAFMSNVTVMMRGGGMSDGRISLANATRAKILTGKRDPAAAMLELWFANVKFPLRPLRRTAGKFLVWLKGLRYS